MQETINSDCNLTMLAMQAFEDIIDNVQSSGLNFQLQISPFSAIISLKKSLVRDRSGNPIIPNKYLQMTGKQMSTSRLSLPKIMSLKENWRTLPTSIKRLLMILMKLGRLSKT